MQLVQSELYLNVFSYKCKLDWFIVFTEGITQEIGYTTDLIIAMNVNIS